MNINKHALLKMMQKYTHKFIKINSSEDDISRKYLKSNEGNIYTILCWDELR